MTKTYAAMDIANYIIWFANNSLELSITNLQLQKFLYFSYVEYLIGCNDRLFSDSIEKWQYGPVVPSVYHAFKDYGFFSISKPKEEFDVTFIDGRLQLIEKKFDPNLINSEFRVSSSIQKIINKWIEEDPFKMVEFTHKEPMWKDYEDRILSGERGLEYGDDEIKSFYQKESRSGLPF
ncbi:Panacea domain-containing protein [Acinetobacter larvae]|uniref:Antitoxin SocA-like Panacea domain-containing protein n=1 Tax=Acinetobacter larvae TaxID=1789224 RepID=A0A1B2LZ35_9GAMM|nr:type II toxin-antitoxin system antitoxin SocA domain-containing protein [Acinetobacter larvae]AOA58222.1 hypothetical protein BFG52_07565 [Acinetobacter larvae]